MPVHYIYTVWTGFRMQGNSDLRIFAFSSEIRARDLCARSLSLTSNSSSSSVRQPRPRSAPLAGWLAHGRCVLTTRTVAWKGEMPRTRTQWYQQHG